MKMQTLRSMLVSGGVTLGMALVPLCSAYAQGFTVSQADSASIELGNVLAPDGQEPAVTDAGVGAATQSADAVAQNADASAAEAPKDPRELYREKVMKEPEGQPMSATSAVSRRYKKMDKAAYQASMLEPAAPVAPAPQ